MDGDSFYILIDLFVAGSGIYVIAQYLFMVRKKELRQNMLLPKEIPIEKCKDVEGYIKTIATKQLIFGIATVLCGAVSLAQDFIGDYNFYLSMVALAIFLIFCIWYGRASRKAIEQFW